MFKKNQLLFIIIIFTFIYINCNKKLILTEDEEFGIGDDYLVYSAVLNYLKNDYDLHFVLSDSTINYIISDDIDYLKENIPELENETIYNYQINNEEMIRLKNIPDLEIQCSLIASSEKGKWKERFPNADALIHFSRIGFHSSMGQALVYFSEYSAPLAASGNIFFLVPRATEPLNEEGKWIVKKSIMLWIS